jgi:hypothetical protein
MDFIIIIISIMLIVSGSIGINYYNRLADCDPDDIENNEFGRVYSIISICAGVLYLVFKIVMLIIKVAVV